MPKTEVLTFHGWGFDARCWHALEKEFANLSWHHFDRGYYGDPQYADFSSHSKHKIIFTHSYGYHFCPDELFAQCDGVAIFAGFETFHPSEAMARRRSERVLHEMIKQFDNQPRAVLNAFYRNVFHPQKSYKLPPEDLDKYRLLKDLKKLDAAGRSVPPLKNSAKVCIFHGREDAIIPSQKGRRLCEKMGEKARLIKLNGAGHALPMQQPEQCVNFLENILF